MEVGEGEGKRDKPVNVNSVEVVRVDDRYDTLDKGGAARGGRDSAREVLRVGPATDGDEDLGVVAVSVLNDALEDLARVGTEGDLVVGSGDGEGCAGAERSSVERRKRGGGNKDEQ